MSIILHRPAAVTNGVLPFTPIFATAPPPSAFRPAPNRERIELQIKKAAVLCLLMCALVAPRADAQMTWTDNGFVNLNGGFQAGSHTLANQQPFQHLRRDGDRRHYPEGQGGGFFDVSAGYKVWRNLAVGVGYSWTSSKADAAISANIPDQLVTDLLRPASGSAPDLNHTEGVINLVGTWMVPVTDKIDVGIAAGPSIFMVKQDLPDALTVNEPGPTISGVTTRSVSKTGGGFHAGIDVTYLVTKRFGVGGLLRYTHGSVSLEGASDGLTVGGFQIGVGGRLRF